jgi:hypothetical protein
MQKFLTPVEIAVSGFYYTKLSENYFPWVNYITTPSFYCLTLNPWSEYLGPLYLARQ